LLGCGADRFSGGAGKDVATDFTATPGDTSDGTIPWNSDIGCVGPARRAR
jgi:hypothetical protein